MKKTLFLLAMMATILTSCTRQKTLVLYYSQTGTT